MTARRIVITADDLGRDPATDAEIAALARDGLITATTAIVVAPHAAGSIAAVRDAGLEPHLHVTLTSESDLDPWRPLTAAPSLVDDAGDLPADPFALGARGEEPEVIAEAEAQLARLRSWGARPAIADSHAGTLYGLHGRSWLAAALQWCAGHGLAFRLPRDPALYVGGPLPPDLADAHAAGVELADTLGVRLPQTIATNRRTAAELGTYDALRAGYLDLLTRLPEGTSEVFLHPSHDGEVAGPGDVVRTWEARLLRDPVWHAALEAEGLELVTGW